MGKVLCFVPENYADFEVVLALHLLRGAGRREIVTVGCATNPVVSFSGLKTLPDCTLEEAAAFDGADALLLPGGPLRKPDERLSSLIRTLDGEKKLLAAICFGPQYLAHAGVLDTRRYTTSCTPQKILKQGIADPFPREHYVAARIVKDGNVITAQGCAFVDFAFAVLEHLECDPAERQAMEQYRRDVLGR